MATSKHEKNHTTEVTYGRQRGHWDSFENCYGEKPGGRSDDDADEGRDAWSDPGDFDDHDAAWEAAEGEDWDDRPDPASLVPTDGRILVIFDVNGVLLLRTGEAKRSAKLRPHVKKLLAMLDQQSERLVPAVWSSMAAHNVDRMVTEVWAQRRGRLAFVWDQRWCTSRSMPGLGKPLLRKDLVKLEQSRYANFHPDNVVLIDDDAHKCTANLDGTAVHPASFTGRDDDCELLRLIQYLEALARSGCRSAREYVLAHPYARPPAAGAGAPSPAAARREAPPQREAPEPKRLRSDAAAAAPAPRTPPDIGESAHLQWRRVESTSQPGVFYYYNSATGESRAEPPPPWTRQESRSRPGTFYYWNSATGCTSVEKPEV